MASTTTPMSSARMRVERTLCWVGGTTGLVSAGAGGGGCTCRLELPLLQITGAAKRYPFPTTVSTNRGFSGSSRSATRILRTAVLML